MRRAFLFLLILAGLHASNAHASAASAATHRGARSLHQVRITPTQLAPGETAIDMGSDQWSFQGYDLRGLLARIYDIEPARVDLQSPAILKIDEKANAGPSRFDVSIDLSGDETDSEIQTILRSAIEDRFHVKASVETQSREVYVLTAPKGAGSGLRAAVNLQVSARHAPAGGPDGASIITIAGRVCPGISSGGITAQAATLERLASALEDNLDRLVLDETNLTRAYNFQVPEYHNREELFSLLHDQLGLTVSAAQRNVKVLAVRSAVQPGAAMMAEI